MAVGGDLDRLGRGTKEGSREGIFVARVAPSCPREGGCRIRRVDACKQARKPALTCGWLSATSPSSRVENLSGSCMLASKQGSVEACPHLLLALYQSSILHLKIVHRKMVMTESEVVDEGQTGRHGCGVAQPTSQPDA